jgi:hypothetical protein
LADVLPRKLDAPSKEVLKFGFKFGTKIKKSECHIASLTAHHAVVLAVGLLPAYGAHMLYVGGCSIVLV